MTRKIEWLCGLTAIAAAALPALAAFTPGNLYVLTNATTGAANVATAAALSVNEYTFNPATGTFGTTPVVRPISGLVLPENNGDHDGLMHFSTDNSSLVFGGYVSTAGTANVVASGATRAVGTLTSTFNLTTTTVAGYTNASLRSVVSTDGKHFWTAGDQGTTSDGGQYYVDASSAVISQTQLNSSDARGNTIDRGQLWSISSNTGGASKVGTGLPTSAAALTLTLAGSYAKSDVVFLDLNNDGTSETAYTTDGKNLIGKWSFNGAAWAAAGTYSGTKTSINDINSLQAFIYNGTVELLAATAAGQLFQFADTNGINANMSFAANVTPTPFLTAAGTTFRGMAIAVPEPTTLALLGGPAMLVRRRRRVARAA